MDTFNTTHIMETLSSTENLRRVWQLAESAEADLVTLADLVCQSFNFRDTAGNLLSSECLQALLAMESQEMISLWSNSACKKAKPEMETRSSDSCLTAEDAVTHIRKTLSSPENLLTVQQLAESAEADLIVLADLVCQSFNFTDTAGNLLSSECLQALLAMESQEMISLRSNAARKKVSPETEAQVSQDSLTTKGAATHIRETLSCPENLRKVQQLAASSKGGLVTLADLVCQAFNFTDADGNLERSECIEALLAMESQEMLSLRSRSARKKVSPEKKSETQIPDDSPSTEVPAATDVPATVNEIEGLRLVLVQTKEDETIWKTLMDAEHPLGAGRLVGHKFLYLITSKCGILGAIGFASAAMKLEDRDRFIGWTTAEQGKQNRDRILNMSRFLIRNSVHCQNLASKVLSMSVTAVKDDFFKKYNKDIYLLETFVDVESFSGTCYRAANWIEVGMTKGRGRNDSHNDTYKTRKAIYVYPLVPDFREHLGVDMSTYAPIFPYYKIPVEVSDHLGADEWAEFEFGNCDLGHAARTNRLIKISTDMAKEPTKSYTSAVKGDKAAITAYYRFFEKCAKAVNSYNIFKCHMERTIQRSLNSKVVLCLQDEVYFTYTSLLHCIHLRKTGKNQTSADSRGLIAHSSLGFDPYKNLSLGLLWLTFVPEIEKDPYDPRSPYEIPLCEKKLFSWVEHARNLNEIAKKNPDTMYISVGDRENDFFEYFLYTEDLEYLESIVRAKNDRYVQVLSKDGSECKRVKLFSLLEDTEEAGRIEVIVPRQSERGKLSKQKASKKREQRKATLSVRYNTVTILPPQGMKNAHPITLSAVYAVEINPPKDDDPVSWRLLTTLPVNSFEDAVKCIEFYTKRWNIEEFHRVIKSGCNAEKVMFRTAEALMNIITIKMIIAWRITLLLQLGREVPDLPPDLFFDDKELGILRSFAASKKKDICNLHDAVIAVASLAGYMNRKNDPEPGYELFWRGYEKLQIMRFTLELVEDYPCFFPRGKPDQPQVA